MDGSVWVYCCEGGCGIHVEWVCICVLWLCAVSMSVCVMGVYMCICADGV